MASHINPANNVHGNASAGIQPFPQNAPANSPPRRDGFRHPAQFVAAMEEYFNKDMSRFYSHLNSQEDTPQGREMFKAAINHSHLFRDYLNIANPPTFSRNRNTAKIEPYNAPAALARAATHLDKDTRVTRALDYINELISSHAFPDRASDFTESMRKAVNELAKNLNCIKDAANKNKAIGIVNTYRRLLSPQIERDFLSTVNPGAQPASASMSSVSANQMPEIGSYGLAIPQFVSAMESYFGNNMQFLYNHLRALPASATSRETFKCMINGSRMLQEYLNINKPTIFGRSSNSPKIAFENAPAALARAATHLTEDTRTARALKDLDEKVSTYVGLGRASNPVFASSVSEAAGELALNLKYVQGKANRDTAIRIINICRPHLHPDTQNYIHDLLSTEYQSPPPLREDYADPAQFAAAMEEHFGYNMPRLYEYLKAETSETFQAIISNSHMLRDYLHIADPASPGYSPITPRIHPHHAPEAVAGAATHVTEHTDTLRALSYLESQVPRFLTANVSDLQFTESFCNALVELSANLNYIAENPRDPSHNNNKNRALAIINNGFIRLDAYRQRTVQTNLSVESQSVGASTSGSA